MKSDAQNPDAYIEELPEERKEAMTKLRKIIQDNLPEGFEEGMNYNMIGFYVPHSEYPAGYHVNPELPLPFINIASQKNFIALYHSGIYASPELLEWFINEYPKHCKYKLDMGKSCIRFKKTTDIPYPLIGELLNKMSMNEWVQLYEKNIRKT